MNIKRQLPDEVVSRVLSIGEVGEKWLNELDGLIKKIEMDWKIAVGEALEGGTHAFVAHADGKNGEKYVVKIDIPENVGGSIFMNSVNALLAANGNGYAKLYAYDEENKIYLMERLGKSVGSMGYSVNEQIKLICTALNKAWEIPLDNAKLPYGGECTAWFKEFIPQAWEDLSYPCSERVVKRALSYLNSRDEHFSEDDCVLIHGDAHATNILQDLNDAENFKFIDPDGAVYEKASDLGVLMREWHEEYEVNAYKKGQERCEYIHSLTGVDKQAIWEWGYIQTVSTGLVLLSIGRKEFGIKMLKTAESWSEML